MRIISQIAVSVSWLRKKKNVKKCDEEKTF